MKTRCKRLLSVCLAILLSSTLFLTSASAAQGLSNFTAVSTYQSGLFTDVRDSDWFSSSVETAYELGLMKGVGASSFLPGGTMTLGEAVALAARLHSIYYTGTETFRQSSPWYQVYVDYALEQDILPRDYSDYTAQATRETCAVLFSRALPASAFPAINTIADGSLSDVVSSKDEIYLLYRAGILTGNDAYGTFVPNSTITRSEVAALVSRIAVPSQRKYVQLQARPSAGSGNGKELISSPLSQNASAPEGAWIQDFANYCNGTFSYEEPSESKGFVVRSFNGEPEDMDVVQAYIELLCQQGFQVVDSYDRSYSRERFFSWGLDYTGPNANALSTMNIQFLDDDSSCNLCVWGTATSSRIKVKIYVPRQISIADAGLRYGGQNVSVQPSGPSASAGLYRLADGSYETTDGRLRTTSGSAMILRDGARLTGNVSFVSSETRDELWVEDYYRNEKVYFTAPAGQMISGDQYTQRELERKGNGVLAPGTLDEGFLTGIDWGTILGVLHSGAWTTPLYDNVSTLREATVRALYLDRGGDAVFYVYARFDTAPYELELLAAAPVSRESPSEGERVQMRRGESQAISFNDREFLPAYETYSWEILSGDTLISLTNTSSQTCTVRALASGVARVQVTYTYGAHEPDVLTGIDRTVSKSKTSVYVIEIS